MADQIAKFNLKIFNKIEKNWETLHSFMRNFFVWYKFLKNVSIDQGYTLYLIAALWKR